MAKDEGKTKKQLLCELTELRHQVTELKEMERWNLSAEKRVRGEYEQLISIFDSIDEIVYVADPESYELLYANNALKKAFGNVVGKKCYNVLQNIGYPCSFCTNNQIFGENLGKVYIWEFQNTVNKHWYHCIDRAIKWPDGRMVRYEMAIDVNERKLSEEELKESHKQLRNLGLHLQKIREEERCRIARDIHDELGQVLTAIKFDADWVSKKLNENQKPLLDRAREISKISDDAIQTVKKIASELRPALLDDLGLEAALEWQAEEFEHRTGIICELTIERWNDILSKDISVTVFRIFQEALTNVARYSGATKVDASLKRRDGELTLEIIDNGKGITERDMSKPGSFGLIGMRERLYPWGGEVKVSGIRGKGTTVRVTVPNGTKLSLLFMKK